MSSKDYASLPGSLEALWTIGYESNLTLSRPPINSIRDNIKTTSEAILSNVLPSPLPSSKID